VLHTVIVLVGPGVHLSEGPAVVNGWILQQIQSVFPHLMRDPWDGAFLRDCQAGHPMISWAPDQVRRVTSVDGWCEGASVPPAIMPPAIPRHVMTANADILRNAAHGHRGTAHRRPTAKCAMMTGRWKVKAGASDRWR